MAIVTADQNVKFNGTLDDVVVLKVDGTDKTVVLWDNLSLMDQAVLTELVTAYGGDAPMAAAVEGYQTVLFDNVAGADATGLSNVSAATAGVATIDIGGDKAGGDASGLATASGNTQGSQIVNFSVTPVGSNLSGLTDTVSATPAHQVIEIAPAIDPATKVTALPAGTYSIDITADGVLDQVVITTSGGETYNEIATLINEVALEVALGGAVFPGLLDFNTLEVDWNASYFTAITITTTSASTILVAAGTGVAAGGDLFTAMALADSVTFTPSAPVDGADQVKATYTATIVVDGVSKAISVTSDGNLTFTQVLSDITTDLAGAATIAIVGDDIKVTSATTGSSSTVSISDVDLFSSMNDFQNISSPVNGDGTATKYTAIVEVDGVLKSVVFNGTAGATLTDVVAEINADLGASATASISGGNIIITSATTGTASKVRVYDSGFLFTNLTGYAGFSYVDGVAPTTYVATVVVDGVDVPVDVVGSDAQTITTLLAEINTDLGAAATAALTGGNIVITSATTGLASTVVVRDRNLFNKVTGYVGMGKSWTGAVDLVEVFENTRSPNGSTYNNVFPHVTVGVKPADNTAYVPPKLPEFTYYGGSPAAWRYMNDDTAVNP